MEDNLSSYSDSCHDSTKEGECLANEVSPPGLSSDLLLSTPPTHAAVSTASTTYSLSEGDAAVAVRSSGDCKEVASKNKRKTITAKTSRDKKKVNAGNSSYPTQTGNITFKQITIFWDFELI